MRRTATLPWFVAAYAPWMLAAGIVLSFTAGADNEPHRGLSLAPAYRQTIAPDARLVPPAEQFARAALLRPSDPGDVEVTSAIPTGGISLHAQLKPDVTEYPQVARGGKGAALATVVASFSRRGLEIAKSVLRVPQHLAFARNATALPPTLLMRGATDAPDWAASRTLEPWSGPDPTLTHNASSPQSPAAAAAGSTGAAGSSGRPGGDGSTPRSARALVLSSATPAPAEAGPLEIAAVPVSLPIAPMTSAMLPLRVEPDLRPHYADLIDPDHLDREQRCLAEAVYFEARSEPAAGQAAVAQVVLNRVSSGLYPVSVCGVVYQNRHHHLACQFTFACEGKALHITEPDAWEVAKRIALDVTDGRTYLADVGGATHYHADYVRPYWAKRLKKMDVIGRHVFYQLRPGQT